MSVYYFSATDSAHYYPQQTEISADDIVFDLVKLQYADSQRLYSFTDNVYLYLNDYQLLLNSELIDLRNVPVYRIFLPNSTIYANIPLWLRRNHITSSQYQTYLLKISDKFVVDSLGLYIKHAR